MGGVRFTRWRLSKLTSCTDVSHTKHPCRDNKTEQAEHVNGDLFFFLDTRTTIQITTTAQKKQLWKNIPCLTRTKASHAPRCKNCQAYLKRPGNDLTMNLGPKTERELPHLKSAMQNFNLIMEKRPITAHEYFQSTCRLHSTKVMGLFIVYYGVMYLSRKQNKDTRQRSLVAS